MFRLVHGLATFTCLSVLLSADRCISEETIVANWPQFRGPDATGVSHNTGLPDKWSATENVEWKTEIPGRGWGSPIVWGDYVFLPTVVNTGTTEPLRKGLYFGGDRKEIPTSIHEWKVLCLDLATGSKRWEKTIRTGTPTGSIHLKNSYASETPVTDGEHVYFCFGDIGIFCFDFKGEQIWVHELAPHKMRNGWGTAASPVLHENVLYYVNDNDEHSSLVALDKRTGKTLWETERDEKSNWATPFIWSHDKATEIVTAGTGAVRSYDLQGKLLWSLKGMSSITIATPYVADGLLYVSSGYVMDPIKALYAIKPGATGDLTLSEGQSSNEFIVWSSPKIAPYNPSTIVDEGRLFVLYDRGLASCFNSTTGETLFEKRRLDRGTEFTASPWSYDGKWFCLNEDGVCSVIKAGDSMEVLHANSLADDDLTLSTPAIAGDRLLIRADKRVYCIRNLQKSP
jgi:outer membrane protein assembly factor BamB